MRRSENDAKTPFLLDSLEFLNPKMMQKFGAFNNNPYLYKLKRIKCAGEKS